MTGRLDGSDGSDDGILALLGFGTPATLGPLDSAPAPTPESIAPDSSFVAPAQAAPAQPAPATQAPVDSFSSLIAGIAPTSTLQAAQHVPAAVQHVPAAAASAPIAPA